MKRITLLIFTTLLASAAFGQITPDDFLNMAPNPSGDICQMKGEAKGDLQRKITELTDSLVARIDRQNAIASEMEENNADERGAGALRNVGFTGATAQKVKSAENISDAEVEAMATQMMQKKLNLSMDDIKDLDKLDSTGQKAWAEGVATEQMANAQTNPQQTQADQLRIKSQYKMASQQKSMLDKRLAGESKYSQKLDSLDKDAAKANVKLDIRLKPLYKQLATASEDQSRSLYQQIQALRDQYCQQFTPRYLEILADYKLYIRKILPDIKKQEAIQNKLTRAQTGVAQDILQPDLLGLEEVKAYYFLLGDIFKYNH